MAGCQVTRRANLCCPVAEPRCPVGEPTASRNAEEPVEEPDVDRGVRHHLGGGTGPAPVRPGRHLRPLSPRRSEIQKQGRAIVKLLSSSFPIPLPPCVFFLKSALCVSPLPPLLPYLEAAPLSQQVSVSDSPSPWLTGPWQKQLIKLGKAATHFSPCFGCRASLPSFAYPACSAHLPVLAGLPPDDSLRTCLVLLCSFSVNLAAFLSACLFVGQS